MDKRAVLIVGLIVAFMVFLSCTAPFPGDVRVTMALVGITVAFVVADRLKLKDVREQRGQVEGPLECSARHPGSDDH